MNDQHANILREMGIGPIWKLRQTSPVAEALTQEQNFLPRQNESQGVPLPGDARAPRSLAAYPMSACCSCGLSEGAASELFGAGGERVSYLLVGESPPDRQSRQGQVDNGTAGALLDNMLRALNVQRGAGARVIKLIDNPSGDVDDQKNQASAEEIALCLPCLKRHIKLMQPVVMIVFGKNAAVALLELDNTTQLSDLRGRMHQFEGVPLVVTYHPGYLLQQSMQKAQAWEDLCLAMDSRTVN